VFADTLAVLLARATDPHLRAPVSDLHGH
jgi:hypothetical protein